MTRHRRLPQWAVLAGGLAFLVVAMPPRLRAQRIASDTLTLARLETMAIERDPRARQTALLAAQSALRLRNIDAERFPSLVVSGQGQYQSDVLTLPFQLPGGQAPPTPPHDTYDAHVEVQQRLLDPTAGTRRAIEDAQLAASQSRVQVSLFTMRQYVDEAFFRALRLQQQHDEVETSITDLDAQRQVAEDRVRVGSALPSEVASLQAELLRRRQSVAEIDANRAAAIRVLSELTGKPITSDALLALPELGPQVERARAVVDLAADRPERQQFERERTLLQRQEDAVAARQKPRVSAFGRVGYGRPGLDPLNRSFDAYWLAGVQVQWTPWTWGTTRRDQEVLALQRQIVTTEESAFTEALRRSIAEELPAIQRLEETRASDERIIALREQILAETRIRYREGVVTSAEYVDRQTDLLAARLARAAHRVELEQARARLLTRLGRDSQ